MNYEAMMFYTIWTYRRAYLCANINNIFERYAISVPKIDKTTLKQPVLLTEWPYSGSKYARKIMQKVKLECEWVVVDTQI